MDQSTERARWHGILIGLLRPISWFTFSRDSSVSIESTEHDSFNRDLHDDETGRGSDGGNH
jgi:hypothetical protein